MMELHLPLIELAILTPLIGAICVLFVSDPNVRLRRTLIISVFTFAISVAAWLDFNSLRTFEAHDRQNLLTRWLSDDLLVIDELSAPLLPMGSFLFLLTVLATLKTKAQRFPCLGLLLSNGILLAIFTCREPWTLILLLSIQAMLPMFELVQRNRPTRIYQLHMSLFVLLLVGGWVLISSGSPNSLVANIGFCLVVVAVLIRSGCIPFHLWTGDLFNHASFATALLYTTPMTGVYAASRLLLPLSLTWLLQLTSMIALATAFYSAGMALVQIDSRRFFCYLFLSHSSLALVGLEMATPIGLTGGLCVWLAAAITMTGFGLTLRAVESRTGRLFLDKYHGLYSHFPTLATFFLLSGLASIGFPGLIGFVGTELVIEGVIEYSPAVGILVVIAMALNSIAIFRAYFLIFTGTKHASSFCLKARWPERIVITVLATLMIVGGCFPQLHVSSRYHAALEIIKRRDHNLAELPAAINDDSER